MVLAAWVAVTFTLGAPHAIALALRSRTRLPEVSNAVAPTSRVRLAAASNSAGAGSPSDYDCFGRALAQRIAQVKDRETKLPVVVLDTMLPRQVRELVTACC